MRGKAPSGWERTTLGDITAPVNRTGGSAELPVLSVSKVLGIVPQGEKFRRRIASVDTARYRRVRHGEFAYDPMLLWDGSISRQTRVPEGLISPAYEVFSATEAVDHTYLLFLLKCPEMVSIYRNVSVGTNVRRKQADYGTFSRIEVTLPPLPEQKKIAIILSSVDEAIQATQLIIDQTRRVKEGLLQDLLLRGLPGHMRFKQTEIGEIPESWEVRRVEDVCSRVGVGIAASATHAYRDRGVPLIRNQNIKYGYLDLSDLLYIDEAYDRENHTKRLHTGDVLTIRTGYPGVSAVVPPTLNKAQSFTTLVSSPNPKLIRSEFLATWINGPVGRRLVLAGEAGGAQHNFNAGELKRLLVPLPALSEQDGIISILDSLSAAEMMEQKVLRRLGHAKSGLLQDLLTGKVRVAP